VQTFGDLAHWHPHVHAIVADGVFTKTDVTVTAFIGDRNNQLITSPREVFFKTEYGVIEPSCTTNEEGNCSVTWSAIKRPDTGGPGDDGKVTIVAWTIGEETFVDANGNGIFDDGDTAAVTGNPFTDLPEPYVDANENGMHDTGEEIIDTVNGNDPTGANGVHDFADGFWNGGGCAHSSLCSTVVTTNATIWDDIGMNIVEEPAPAP